MQTPDLLFGKTAICPYCASDFVKSRSDQKFCKPACRKAESQTRLRKASPANSTNSSDKRRTNLLLFDRALRLAEMIYTSAPDKRLGIVKAFVDQAKAGDFTMRHILTNRVFLYPDTDNRNLFFRRQPTVYLTVSQAADKYCHRFWGMGVREVLAGASEPPTGEVQPAERSSP